MTNRLIFAAVNEVHLWQGHLHAVPFPLTRLAALLSEEERSRAGRFRFPEHRESYTVAHGLLRELLGRYLGLAPEVVEISDGPGGKPQLVSPQNPIDLRFNLSHTKDVLLFGFAQGTEIGVDVECTDRGLGFGRLVGSVLSEDEARYLLAQPAAERAALFIRFWTQKEAYLKARGVGLAGDMSSISLILGADSSHSSIIDHHIARDASGWSLFDLPCAEGYRAAAAVALAEPVQLLRQFGDLR